MKKLCEGQVMNLRYVFIVLPFVCVCIGSVGGSETVAEPGAASLIDPTLKGRCSEQTVERCVTRTDCTTIVGWIPKQGEAGLCVDFSSQPAAIGCRSNACECGEAITVAAPPYHPDRCIWFPTTCVPAGWRGCDVDDVPDCPSP